MTIFKLDVRGFFPAMRAMRRPMDSHYKSDSKWEMKYDETNGCYVPEYIIGEEDKKLSIKLQKAGPEHCKHLRQVVVWAEILAPREW